MKAPFLKIVAGTAFAGHAVTAERPAGERPERKLKEQATARSLSKTAENEHLRADRREVWRMAEAATHYWRARLDFGDAVLCVQRWEMPEGRSHAIVTHEDCGSMVNRWRAAMVKQLLTPAPDVAAVKWKQIALARRQHAYTDVKTESIERSIADDLAFLAAHPVRQSKRRIESKS